MIHKLAVLFCSLACACLPALGQDAKVLKESGTQKLAVFLGTWRSAGVDSEKISALFNCRWSPNGGYLIADQQITMNGATTNSLSIYNYNPETKDYTITLVGIKGMAPFTAPIVCHGDTLIYGGGANRTLNIFESAERYRYVIQSSGDGGRSWKTLAEGWSRKVKD
jgi:hypothetical protein